MTKEELLYRGTLNADDTVRREVFNTYLPLLHGICLRYVKSSEEADDVVQEGFIKIFTKIESFTWKGKGSFIGWMRRVVVNTAINHYRKASKDDFVEINNDLNGVSDEYFDDDASESLFETVTNSGITDADLIEMLQELPEQFKVVFNLFAIEGYKHKDIAEMLGVPINTSISRYTRAKEKLRKSILKKIENKEIFKNA